jgi:hypothetical protein
MLNEILFQISRHYHCLHCHCTESKSHLKFIFQAASFKQLSEKFRNPRGDRFPFTLPQKPWEQRPT